MAGPAGLLGSTRRGLPVYGPTHDSYKNLERVRLLGARPSELGQMARQAHPNYRAVDHEEASIMHHQRQNFHAARAHQAASETMSKGENKGPQIAITPHGHAVYAHGNQLTLISSSKRGNNHAHIDVKEADGFGGVADGSAFLCGQKFKNAWGADPEGPHNPNENHVAICTRCAGRHSKLVAAHAKSGKVQQMVAAKVRPGSAKDEVKKSEGAVLVRKNLVKASNKTPGVLGKTESGKDIDAHTHPKYAKINATWEGRKDDDDSAQHLKLATQAQGMHPDWSPRDHYNARSKHREGPGFGSGAHQAHHFAAQAGGALGADAAAFHAKSASEHLADHGKMKRPFTDREAKAIGREIYKHHKNNPDAPGLTLDAAARRLTSARKLPPGKIEKSALAKGYHEDHPDHIGRIAHQYSALARRTEESGDHEIAAMLHRRAAAAFADNDHRHTEAEHLDAAREHDKFAPRKVAAKGLAKSLTALGETSSGLSIAPAFSSPLQWVYAGMDPKTGIDDAATAIQAVTPGWSKQDHAEHGAAYHDLALTFAKAQPPDERTPICAAAAFMHLAACGINPAQEPLIQKSFLVPDAKARPIDHGPATAAANPSLSADDHLKMAKRHLDGGSTKRALRHIQAAAHLGATARGLVKKSEGQRQIGNGAGGLPVYDKGNRMIHVDTGKERGRGTKPAANPNKYHISPSNGGDDENPDFTLCGAKFKNIEGTNYMGVHADDLSDVSCAKCKKKHQKMMTAAGMPVSSSVAKSDRKPLGAAFSHAKKVAAKTGGGKKKERAAANRYLKREGHEPMGKAMLKITLSKATNGAI